MTPSCGAVNTIEEKDTILGVLSILRKWAHGSLMRFNKARCRMLHLGWGNCRHSYRVGESKLEKTDLEALVDKKLQMSQQLYSCSPECQQ